MIARSDIEWLKERFENNQAAVENEYIGAGYTYADAINDRARAEALFTELLKEERPKHWLLFYMPPCGRWYVHSHKIYSSHIEAEMAAEKFLHPETPFSIRSINLEGLEP